MTDTKTELSLTLSERHTADFEMIANGGFAPLTGFQGSEDWRSVCETMRTASADYWPIPITLASDLDCAVGDVVSLTSDEGKPLGRLTVEEIYERDGRKEAEQVYGTTDDAHPMHLHLVQFQILHRQGFNIPAMQSGKLELVGKLRMPADNEAGWKDTAVVNPGDVLTILVRFEGYTGRYVFHCHMLEHEDNDMMRPYEVVPVVVRRDGPATTPKVD